MQCHLGAGSYRGEQNAEKKKTRVRSLIKKEAGRWHELLNILDKQPEEAETPSWANRRSGRTGAVGEPVAVAEVVEVKKVDHRVQTDDVQKYNDICELNRLD